MNRTRLTRFAASLAIVAAIVGTSAATSAVHRLAGTAAAVKSAPRAHLMAFGGRSPAQQRSGLGAKFDAQLADLARHANRARPGSAGLLDLHSMNPAAHFIVSRTTGTQYVAVDAITRGDVQQLKAALTALGMRRPATYLNDVGGWLPVSALNAAAALPQLHSIRAAMWRAHAGAVTSQGDYVQGSAAARTASGTDGTGITVGILSDSYDCYSLYAQPGSGVPASGNQGYAPNGFTATAADDIASGDLPAAGNINILEEAGSGTDLGTCGYSADYFLPNGDEGRAMMQIVHDVAPGAKLAFHTAANTEADFAQGIHDLATAGAKVIADDVSYFDEPFFQDGLVAQAVNSVNAAGVSYFSAAGNSGSNGYDNTGPDFSTASTIPAGETLLNFDTTGATTTTGLAVNIPQLEPGQFIAVILQWDQPYVTGAAGSGGATSQMDLCITGSDTGLVSAPQNPNDPNGGAVTNLDNQTQVCTGANNTGTDPYQILILGFPAAAASGSACPTGATASFCSDAQQIVIQVGHAGGTTPGRIKVAIDDNGSGVSYPVGGIVPTGGTLQGHPSATGAMAVGAAFWYDTTVCDDPAGTELESYSAKGGDPILFNADGTAKASAELRQKPDIVGPDGGSDTFLGFKVGAGGTGQCSDTGLFPNFFGTSAATPHVAAVAALMLQNNPGLTPAQIYTAMRSTTSPMTGTSTAPDNLSGYGFIQADAALASAGSGDVTVNLGLNPTTINVGQSATLTWSSTNTNSCTASGSWPTNGPISTSGNLVVTPSAAGSYTYTFTCTNSDSNALESQTLTVVTPSSGGGGGGALDLAALLALSGAALARLRRTRRELQA